MTIQEHIDAALAEGFEIIQEGRILMPFSNGPPKTDFDTRAEGFKIGLMGSYPPPTYRSVYENRLFDDDERWVHLQRKRGSR